MLPILEFITLFAAGLFAGAAVYVAAVEHPARMASPTPAALAEYRPSYRRGAVMQASLAGLGGLGGLAVSLMNNNFHWAIGGMLLLTLIPYTIVVIMPTSHRLSDTESPVSDSEAEQLLRRWGNLHLVRVAFGVGAFAVILAGVFLD
jgi:hypothetical protein